MHIIQIIILASLALSFGIVFLVMKRHFAGRLFFMLQFIAGAVFVLFPELLTKVARLVGVGRGTDLLLYFLVVLFYMTVLFMIAALRRIEKRQTEIIRQIAIRDARERASSGQ